MDVNCAIYQTAEFVGKRWTLLILLEIYKGKKQSIRFNELKKKLPGITSKILSSRLKELEKERLVCKKVKSSEIREKNFYQLTGSGRSFIKIIQDMKKWTLKTRLKNKSCAGTDCACCTI